MMESPQTTLTRLERVIAEALGANVSPDELRRAARLDDLVAVDSVALLEFALGIEHEFSIRLEAGRFTRDFITDLPALVAYLEQRHEARPEDGRQA
jgi:acyl carrier protein